MAYFAGVDISISSTGIAVVEYLGDSKFKLIDKKTISPSRHSKGFDRKLENYQVFKFYTENFSAAKEISFFVLENYSYGSPGKIADLGELGGLYRFQIVNNLKKSFDVLAPQSVKKIVAGSGRATKEEVRDSLSKYIEDFDSINFNNYDESDAVAIAVAYGLLFEKNNNEQSKS